MFTTRFFPEGLLVRHVDTAFGTFWFFQLPTGKFLWGIDDETLGIERNAETVMYWIRHQKTGYLPWDNRGDPDRVPALQAWAKSRGAGDFAMRVPMERSVAAYAALAAG